MRISDWSSDVCSSDLLDFDPAEEPVALQLGGSEPQALAESARLGRQWGYDEINLNCGCPSERVQRGAFGACLMAEPDLVAEIGRASCRERVCTYVSSSVCAVSLQKKQEDTLRVHE